MVANNLMIEHTPKNIIIPVVVIIKKYKKEEEEEKKNTRTHFFLIFTININIASPHYTNSSIIIL